MIKGLMGGQGLVVNGGNTSMPYVSMSNSYGNNNNPMQGMLRISGTDLQVFDGNVWQNVSTSYATVELNGHTQNLLKWVEAQRDIALRRTEMASKHPALMKALEAIKRAEDNFDLLEKFVEHDIEGDEHVQASP